MTDDPVARLPTDAAARRLPEFIRTLRINRAARRESVYASDNVYALLDALDTAEARVRELEAELAELNQVFDFRYDANMRAIKMWQAAHPGNDLVWPDSADLCVWLLTRLSTIEAETIERCAKVADDEVALCDARAGSSALGSNDMCRHDTALHSAANIAAAIRQLVQVKHEAE